MKDAIPVEPRQRHGPDAGYGLFATTASSSSSSSSSFSIPNSALVNKLTLSSLALYPTDAHLRLTAIQLISLHLSLHRNSPDPIFGPYISTLPTQFDAHPLTWLSSIHTPAALLLLPTLPPAVTRNLHNLAHRFNQDWLALQSYMLRLPKSTPIRVKKTDYLWAWLNVNTRSLYYRVEPSISHKDNITLCPILDFANHTPIQPLSFKTGPSVLGNNFTILPPPSAPKPGDEVYLTYGPHPNRTLFVDYGFVNEISKEILITGNVQGEVDIQNQLETLFAAKGQLGLWMQDVLTNNGYWGDWTLHFSPLPAHPSFRVIVALRLYHLFPESLSTIPSNAELLLHSWSATLLGIADKISQENEDAWRSTLLHICNRTVHNALSAIKSLEKVSDLNQSTWFPWMKKNIRMLWEEEMYVATAVADSLQTGEEF